VGSVQYVFHHSLFLRRVIHYQPINAPIAGAQISLILLLSCVPRDALRGNHSIRPWRVDNIPVGAHSGLWRTSREYVRSSALTGVLGAGDRAPKNCHRHPPPLSRRVHQAIEPLVSPWLPFAASASGSSSRRHSAASFWSMTCSQKETTASQDIALRAIAWTTAGSERSTPNQRNLD
jgi:hypothetical protein